MSTPHEDANAEAAAWLRENAPEPVKPAAAPSSPEPPSSPPPAEPGSHAEPVDSDDDDDQAEDDDAPRTPPTPQAMQLAEQLSVMGWTLLDTFVPKQFGTRMKLTAEERAELIRVSVPVVASRLPTDLSEAGELSPDELLLMTAALIYGPKYFSPEPAALEPKSPSGGGEQKPEGSASSGTSTEANVDGRKIEATVHELKQKKANA